MAEYHYQCIGGPKDGERYAPKPGQTTLECAEMPPLWRGEYNVAECKIHVYDLKLMDNGRLAWIYRQ